MNATHFYQFLIASLLLSMVTAINHVFASHLGLTGVVSSFLILVVLITYYFKFPLGLLAAIAAFLVINFFFVNPLYTWEVAELASWAALIGFLVVSIVISTLIRQLRNKTELAEFRRQRAEFSKLLAEEIAAASTAESLLSNCCQLLLIQLDKPVAIAQHASDRYAISCQAGKPIEVSQSALFWAANNGKMAGPGTDNWPELSYWLIPFERLPNKAPVLLIGDAMPEEAHMAQDFRIMTDQLCNAYQRLCNAERARLAELRAQEESIHNTLLASISHDMRTPLTGIIGAAETLLDQQLNHQADTQFLLKSILSEAEHLAISTENILSIVQLESSNGEQIAMDWQSPEEIVGLVMQRYRERGLEHRVFPQIFDNSGLIKGNATLLTQALFNLVENALRVQPDVEPLILRVQRQDQCLDLSVLDEGPGFPEDFQTENIRKFYPARDRGRRSFGLGLSIAHAVAQKHGAELMICKRSPKGSSVTLRFFADSLRYQNDQ